MSDESTIQHLNQIFYMDLGLCGCGNPDDAYELVRDLLALCPSTRTSGGDKLKSSPVAEPCTT